MILEIRTYRLKPGTQAEFVRVMRHDALPLLAKYGIRVVGAGASLVAEDGHEGAYLIRAFESIGAREDLEAAFYASADWREGPREAVLAAIESYHTVVIEVSEDAISALSHTLTRQ